MVIINDKPHTNCDSNNFSNDYIYSEGTIRVQGATGRGRVKRHFIFENWALFTTYLRYVVNTAQ